MNNSERINYILDHYNLTPSELSRKMGLPRPQTIYDIQSGKTGISKTNAELICKEYPEISIEWVSFGRGHFLKKDNLNREIEDPAKRYNSNCEECIRLNAKYEELKSNYESIKTENERLISENAILKYLVKSTKRDTG